MMQLLSLAIFTFIANGKDDQIHPNKCANKKNIIGDEERMTLRVKHAREYGGSDSTSASSRSSSPCESRPELSQTLPESSQGSITIIFNSNVHLNEIQILILIPISIRISMAGKSTKTRELPAIFRLYGISIYFNRNSILIDLTNYLINDRLFIDFSRARRLASRRGSKGALIVNRNIINDKKDDGIVVDEIIDVNHLPLGSPTNSVVTNGSNVTFSMNTHNKTNIYSMNLRQIGLEASSIKSESDKISVKNVIDIDSMHSTHSRGSRVTINAPSEQESLVVAVSEHDNVNDDNYNNANIKNYGHNGIDIVNDYSFGHPFSRQKWFEQKQNKNERSERKTLVL